MSTYVCPYCSSDGRPCAMCGAGAAAGRPSGIQGKDYEWCETHDCRMSYYEGSEMWGCPKCRAAAGRPGDEAAVARIKQAALDLFKNGDGPAFEAVVRAALASAEQHHQEEMARLHGGLLERHETELLAVERRVASAEQRARTQRDRLWCLALLPEGPEVIQRITTRFNASRDDRAAPTEGRGSDSDE